MARALEFEVEEVLEKAMLIFWKKGYYDTSIKDLIAGLGISNASIYNTFGGKRQLFERAFEYYRMTNRKGLQFFLNSQEDCKKGLKMVFEKLINDDKNDEDCKGCFIVNTTTELAATDSKLQQVLELHQEAIELSFFEFLSKGVNNGQIAADKDLKMIARLLYTLMTGLRVLGKTKPKPEESMATVEVVLSLLD